MIDFRYHLVSIIAVFLALAIGIVVGTAAINPEILDGLRGSNAGLIADKRALEDDVRDLRAEVSAADGFAEGLGPVVLEDALADDRVLVVTTPGTDGALVDALLPVLEQAGAQVTGRLALQPALLDPQSTQLVEDLVASVVPAGLELPEAGAVELAGLELAASLTGGQVSAVPDEAAEAVVSAFEEAGLVELVDSGEERSVATAVVVLTGPAPEQVDGQEAALEREQEALLGVARSFAVRADATVLAGPREAAADGGLLAALRGDRTLSQQVSSVDSLERVQSRIAVALALREQAADGTTGSYGSAAGASAPAPSPRPR